jgi:glycosyltransferase involved in cell wall biosynthesis
MDLQSKIVRKLSNIVKYRHLKKVQNKVEKSRGSAPKEVYKRNPQISIILQFFNKRPNIKSIIEALRLTTAEEIIIIDDGSIDGSYEDWIKYLDQPNDFLLRCNDLFEVRTYDRAISMARGELICLLQDDDIPPRNNTWIEQALTLFDTLPDLLILGGRSGLDFLMPDPVDPNKPSEYERIGDIGGCPGVNKHRIYDTALYREPTSGIPFMFTSSVNRAPYICKEKTFSGTGWNQSRVCSFSI